MDAEAEAGPGFVRDDDVEQHPALGGGVIAAPRTDDGVGVAAQGLQRLRARGPRRQQNGQGDPPAERHGAFGSTQHLHPSRKSALRPRLCGMGVRTQCAHCCTAKSGGGHGVHLAIQSARPWGDMARASERALISARLMICLPDLGSTTSSAGTPFRRSFTP